MATLFGMIAGGVILFVCCGDGKSLLFDRRIRFFFEQRKGRGLVIIFSYIYYINMLVVT